MSGRDAAGNNLQRQRLQVQERLKPPRDCQRDVRPNQEDLHVGNRILPHTRAALIPPKAKLFLRNAENSCGVF